MPSVDIASGIAIGLGPSAKYQTSYEPVYYTQTKEPAPVVTALKTGIKLANNVGKVSHLRANSGVPSKNKSS